MKLEGIVKCRHRRGDKVLREFSGKNLIVGTGRILVRDLVSADQSPDRIDAFGVGDDGTVVQASDTALGNEHAAITRGTLTETDLTGQVSLIFTGTITNDSGGTEIVKEIGLFNAAAAGIMLSRFLCQEFDFENNDELDMTWIIVFGEA
jgi:hypothetical protein